MGELADCAVGARRGASREMPRAVLGRWEVEGRRSGSLGSLPRLLRAGPSLPPGVTGARSKSSPFALASRPEVVILCPAPPDRLLGRFCTFYHSAPDPRPASPCRGPDANGDPPQKGLSRSAPTQPANCRDTAACELWPQRTSGKAGAGAGAAEGRKVKAAGGRCSWRKRSGLVTFERLQGTPGVRELHSSFTAHKLKKHNTDGLIVEERKPGPGRRGSVAGIQPLCSSRESLQRAWHPQVRRGSPSPRMLLFHTR
ncbi:uncharacterized protein [Chlorocebus sabaeus]|uniref:uncharacterized protein n=1 Tax=Chlorocebus sabaeus TaxID=60711 RepID=UPI003BF9695B